MRPFLLGISVLILCGLSASQNAIQQVDFKNFTYPLSGTLLGHNRLQWLPTDVRAQRRPIRLVKGKNLTKSSSVVVDGQEYVQWEGFTLQSVSFADVTGHGQREAIVVLHYRSGGTQQTDYVYIYSLALGKPKLLAYFHSGDRAYSGLYKVIADHGELVVELFDPEKKSGDCCSSGIVRTRYKWEQERFKAVGAAERETLDEQ